MKGKDILGRGWWDVWERCWWDVWEKVGEMCGKRLVICVGMTLMRCGRKMLQGCLSKVLHVRCCSSTCDYSIARKYSTVCIPDIRILVHCRLEDEKNKNVGLVDLAKNRKGKNRKSWVVGETVK
jgi:hypothetical protein